MHTYSVGQAVDKVGVVICRPLKPWLVQVCTKNVQMSALVVIHDFPTVAVGVPVDKMLVKGCSPLIAWARGEWLKNDH